VLVYGEDMLIDSWIPEILVCVQASCKFEILVSDSSLDTSVGFSTVGPETSG
jgi:hypothetical protein